MFVDANFGCGSSREHAPQAIRRRGIRAVVGRVVLRDLLRQFRRARHAVRHRSRADAHALIAMAEGDPSTEFAVDLDTMRVTGGRPSMFEIIAARRRHARPSSTAVGRDRAAARRFERGRGRSPRGCRTSRRQSGRARYVSELRLRRIRSVGVIRRPSRPPGTRRRVRAARRLFRNTSRTCRGAPSPGPSRRPGWPREISVERAAARQHGDADPHFDRALDAVEARQRRSGC